jgi:hypothetical protein
VIALVVAAALAAADPCAGVLDRTPACAAPADVVAAPVHDEKLVATIPYDDAAAPIAPSFAVAGTLGVVGGALLVGVSYLYAKNLVDAAQAGTLSDASRESLVFGQRATFVGAVASFAAATLFYGVSAAFFAFDPRTGTFLLPIFPDERD